MHKLTRPLAILGILCLSASLAVAQQVAIPPMMKIIMPFAAGSTTDLFARAIATQLATRLGNTVVVEVRSGGSSMIGAGAVANGPKDGSMLLITTNSTVTAAATLKSVPFDIKKDLMPVAIVGDGPMLVGVSSKTGIKTPADLVATARTKPGGLTHGTSGVGSLPHLSAELFNSAAKVQINHVPYKGGAAAVVDLAAGTIDVMFATHSTFAPHVQSGRVNLVGVTTPQSSPLFPGLPSVASVAPGFSGSVWVAMFASSGIPPALAQRLNREINEIAASKEIRDVLVTNGFPPVALPLDELRKRMNTEYDNWKAIAAAQKIVLE